MKTQKLLKKIPSNLEAIGVDWALQSTEESDINNWYFIIVNVTGNKREPSRGFYQSLVRSVGKLALLPPDPNSKFTLIYDISLQKTSNMFIKTIYEIDEGDREISYRGNLSLIFLSFDGYAGEIFEIPISSFSGDGKVRSTLFI